MTNSILPAELEVPHTSASVVLEMGYDDYCPRSQQTPSRIESLRYPSHDSAQAAARHALQYVSKAYPEYRGYWAFRIDIARLDSDDAIALESVEELIDTMMEHYRDGEDHDGLP